MIAFSGPCWRAVPAGRAHRSLDGTVRAGRYNRPGERALYVSGSREGVAAAMARYPDAPRTVIRLTVEAAQVVDLRDAVTCSVLGIAAERLTEDWMAALDRGEEPASWTVADRVREAGADGLIERSRHAPAAFHLVLFRWNEAGAPRVAVAG